MHLELKALASEKPSRTIENNQQLGNEISMWLRQRRRWRPTPNHGAATFERKAEKFVLKMAVATTPHPRFVKITPFRLGSLQQNKPEVNMQMDVATVLRKWRSDRHAQAIPARTPTIHIKNTGEDFDSDYYRQVFGV